MKRVFFSFHYEEDCWRVSQVKQIGAIDGQKIVSSNDWEQVKRGGDAAIEKWIDSEMNGRSTLVVLIGAHTAGRKWINYEITKAWKDGKGIIGVYIHNLKDKTGYPSAKGSNPFDHFTVDGRKMSEIVPCFNPSSYDTYKDICSKLESWIDQAARK